MISKTYKLLALSILLFAACLRFVDLNWDQGYHLHPDERFLTMVGSAMHMPQSVGEYLNPVLSPLNPNNIGYSFYVYGTFPVVLNWLVGAVSMHTTYDTFYLQGRVFSALADICVMIFIFKIALLLTGKERDHALPLWAMGIYGVSVLPIQLSHFFAVDSFLTLFMTSSLYFVLRFLTSKKFWWAIPAGISFGLALASKISAVYLLPLLVILALLPLYEAIRSHKHKIDDFRSILLTIGVFGALFGLTSYLSLRFADPYMFATGNILSLRPSQLFITNLKTLSTYSSRAVWYPPIVQWVHKVPVLFSVKNLILWGFGIPGSILLGIGMYKVVRYQYRKPLMLVLGWTVLFFLYQSSQLAQTIRYYYPLYPILALIAAYGAVQVTRTRLVRSFIIAGLLLIPALFYLSIYMHPHSRVTASEWIVNHIPPGSVLLSEHWDDALPLPVPGTPAKGYSIIELPVFDPDTSQKWQTIGADLQKANYLILSSNRGWGSIPTVPEKYPRMTQFYKDLFAGKTAYKLVKTVTSYPSLSYLGIPISIPDDSAEEAFTVYDHPKVMIFQKK